MLRGLSSSNNDNDILIPKAPDSSCMPPAYPERGPADQGDQGPVCLEPLIVEANRGTDNRTARSVDVEMVMGALVLGETTIIMAGFLGVSAQHLL